MEKPPTLNINTDFATLNDVNNKRKYDFCANCLTNHSWQHDDSPDINSNIPEKIWSPARKNADDMAAFSMMTMAPCKSCGVAMSPTEINKLNNILQENIKRKHKKKHKHKNKHNTKRLSTNKLQRISSNRSHHGNSNINNDDNLNFEDYAQIAGISCLLVAGSYLLYRYWQNNSSNESMGIDSEMFDALPQLTFRKI